jgi:hypothetical protein
MDKHSPQAPAEAGKNELVYVRRQWNDWRIGGVRKADLQGLHWDDVSGGIGRRSPRTMLYGYVWCDRVVEGEVAHSCAHGRGPHEIKVCVCKKDNSRALYRELEAQAR